MYVFRNADEIKDTLEPAFCYWATRDRGYTQGVGYIKSPRSIRPAMNLLAREGREGGEEGGDGSRDSFHRYRGIFPSICANY